MGNNKLDQWMQSVEAMSSIKIDHAVPVRTHSHAVARSPFLAHSPYHYLRTQPPPTSKPETSKPKTSKPAAVSDQGLQDQVNADSVGSIRIALSQAAPRSPLPCQQLPTHPKRPATPTPPLSGPAPSPTRHPQLLWC